MENAVFKGTFKLDSLTIIFDKEENTFFSDSLSGLLIYDGSGYMIAMIVIEDKRLLESEFVSEEIREKKLIAYGGRYKVYSNFVVHYPQISSISSWREKELLRKYNLVGDLLILETEPDSKGRYLRLTWRKIK